MFSPTSLNFALGMIAEGAKGETKNALNEYLGTDDFAAYARKYMNVIKAIIQKTKLWLYIEIKNCRCFMGKSGTDSAGPISKKMQKIILKQRRKFLIFLIKKTHAILLMHGAMKIQMG